MGAVIGGVLWWLLCRAMRVPEIPAWMLDALDEAVEEQAERMGL